MNIYTKQGDKGYTSFGNEKILKCEFEIECVGTLDELNCVIGYYLSKNENENEILQKIQSTIFDIGACVNNPTFIEKLINKFRITTKELENEIDNIESTLPKLRNFILPRNYEHFMRVVCRRTERRYVEYCTKRGIDDVSIIALLNRLSDYFFVLARKNKPNEVLYNADFI